MPSAHGAKTLIKIVPVKGLTECNNLSRTHDLAIEVVVADFASRQEIWKGGFKVENQFREADIPMPRSRNRFFAVTAGRDQGIVAILSTEQRAGSSSVS